MKKAHLDSLQAEYNMILAYKELDNFSAWKDMKQTITSRYEAALKSALDIRKGGDKKLQNLAMATAYKEVLDLVTRVLSREKSVVNALERANK